MRISDWSSDVCSSDLPGRRRKPRRLEHQIGGGRCYRIFLRQPLGIREYFRREVAALHVELHGSLFQASVDIIWGQTQFARDILGSLALVDAQQTVAFGRIQLRSEEHTSELQSLIRISFDVF